MSFDEAVALLGLTLPFTAKDVRRAYLRLLKVHKPETDPDGFMRLRQAYEMFDGVESVGRREDAREPAAEIETATAPEAESAPTDSADAEPAQPLDEADLLPWQRAVPEDAKVAALLLTDWLERAKADPSAPPPPMGSALALLWSMLERRAFKTASGLYRSIDEWLAHVGGARGQVAWGMTQGLWEMRKRIPEELFAPMVRAVATRNLEEVEARIQAFERKRPGSAGAILYRLESDAPQLAAVFGKAFAVADRLTDRKEDRVARREPVRAGSSWSGAGILAFLALAFVRLLVSSSNEPSKIPPYVPAPEAPRQGHLSALALNVETLRKSAKSVGAFGLAADAGTILDRVTSGDCDGAHDEMSEAYEKLQNLEETAQTPLQPLVSAVATELTLQCGARKN